MDWVLGVLSGKDFLLNLAAGLVIFVLEVILIVGLVPYLVQRSIDRRWQPSRRALLEILKQNLVDYVLKAHTALEKVTFAGGFQKYSVPGVKKSPMIEGTEPNADRWTEYRSFLAGIDELHRDLLDQTHTYGGALDAALLRAVSQCLASVKELNETFRGPLNPWHEDYSKRIDRDAIERTAKRLMAHYEEAWREVDQRDRSWMRLRDREQARFKIGYDPATTLSHIAGKLDEQLFPGAARPAQAP